MKTSHSNTEQNPNHMYPTPIPVVRFAIGSLPVCPNYVLDIGAGNGVWGAVCKEMYPRANVTGVEVQNTPRPPIYDSWVIGDYRRVELHQSFDLIMGNPPYGKTNGVRDNEMVEGFIHKSIKHLMLGGVLILLLKLSFLESVSRKLGVFLENPPSNVYVSSRRIPQPGVSSPQFSHGIFTWGKSPISSTQLGWFDWKDYYDGGNMWLEEDNNA